MKRLLNSSNFWNAVVASIFCVAAFQITKEESLALAVSGLFFARSVATGVSDSLKVNKGIEFNPETKRNEILK